MLQLLKSSSKIGSVYLISKAKYCHNFHSVHSESYRNVIFRYLKKIPNETIKVFERGEKEPHDVIRPLPRSVEIVESSLEVQIFDIYRRFSSLRNP